MLARNRTHLNSASAQPCGMDHVYERFHGRFCSFTVMAIRKDKLGPKFLAETFVHCLQELDTEANRYKSEMFFHVTLLQMHYLTLLCLHLSLLHALQ